MIEEPSPDGNSAFHVIDHWRYITKLDLPDDIYDLGYQISSDSQPTSPQQRTRHKSDDKFDLDIYFILVRFLVNQHNKQLSNLKIWQLIPIKK